MHRSIRPLFPLVVFAFLLSSQGTVFSQTSESNHHFSVNFISIGAGVDYKAEQSLSEYLKIFQQETKTTLHYKIRPWGKEGESEYQFDLKNLSDKEREVFTWTIEKMFRENKMVRVGKFAP